MKARRVLFHSAPTFSEVQIMRMSDYKSHATFLRNPVQLTSPDINVFFLHDYEKGEVLRKRIGQFDLPPGRRTSPSPERKDRTRTFRQGSMGSVSKVELSYSIFSSPTQSRLWYILGVRKPTDCQSFKYSSISSAILRNFLRDASRYPRAHARGPKNSKLNCIGTLPLSTLS
jgi:hypothetical protein